jgi:large subunit ribosomal protein L15e
MSFHKYIHKAWTKPKPMLKTKTMKWRSEKAVKKIDKPTRLDRAHALGYKAKQGFILARVSIAKGGRHRPKLHKGRKPTKVGLIHYTPSHSLQSIAEKRVARKFMNLEVLNSYPVGEDGKYKYFEVILVDKNHPVIKADKDINWIVNQRRRAFRGLTSAGKKSRGTK